GAAAPACARRHGTVRDWMARPPLSVPVECTIGVALGQMQHAGVRHLLVTDGDRLVGIVSNRDVRRLLDDPTHPGRLGDPIGRIMTEGPAAVAPEVPVEAGARLLLESRSSALPRGDGD